MLSPNQAARIEKLSLVILSVIFVAPLVIFSQAVNDQLSRVATQYDELFFSAPYPDGFGIALKAEAILNVTYPSGTVTLGRAYTADEVKTQPTITVIPTNSSFFKANVFTLMLADANALGNPDRAGNYRHFLQNHVTFGDPNPEGALALNAGSGTVVTSYAGPGPLPQTGTHRYAWLLFVQPPSFQAPSNLSSAGVAPSHWFVNNYVSNSKLGDLVAASFFTVQNGDATFSHNATVSYISTPSNSSSLNRINGTSSSNNPARTGATSGHQGPVWADCAGSIKSIIIGLGIAFSGYVLVQ